MRTFARFFLLLLGFGLLPAGAATLYFAKSNALARRNARSLHEQLAHLGAAAASAEAARMNRALAFAVDLSDGKLSPAAESGVVQGAMSAEANLLMVSLQEADGRTLLRLADEKAFPEKGAAADEFAALSRKALDMGRVALGTPRSGGRPYVPLVYPLERGRSVRVAWSLEELLRRLGALKAGAGGRVALADGEGNLIGVPAGGPMPARLRRPPEPEGWLEEAGGGGAPLVAAWAEVAPTGWTVWSAQPRAESFAADADIARRAAHLFGALALFVAGTAFWIARRVGIPLAHLASGARRTSESHFDMRIPEEGWAEFVEVQRAFNAMMRTLEAYQRAQVDKQLQDKAKLEALVKAVPAGIVLCDASGRVLYINAAARRALGEATATRPPWGKSMAQVLRDARLRELVAAADTRPDRSKTVEVELDGYGGAPRLFSCHARAVENGAARVGVLLVLDDVTAQKDLDALRERFLHALVHDLKGPITSMRGWVDIMNLNGGLTESAQGKLKYVQSAALEMQQLVDNILESAKLKAGGAQPSLAPTEACEIIDELRGLFAVQAEIREIDLSLEAPPKGGGLVVCDRRLIARTLANLANNALKFTNKGGRVAVSARPHGADKLEFSVEDTGCGIPKHKLAGVFRPFEQVEGNEAARQGFGLGLSMVKEWVELHGSRIHVESEEGKGSRFAFILPLSPRTGAAPAEEVR